MLNACIRFIYDIPLTNHDLINYYADSHILPIEYRIKYKLCLTDHKILNNLPPQYLSNLFYMYTPLRENLRLGDDCFIIATKHQIEKTISHKICIETRCHWFFVHVDNTHFQKELKDILFSNDIAQYRNITYSV